MKPNALDLFEKFTKRTTCHGLDQITEQGRPTYIKFIWGLALAVLFGGMCWQLTARVLEYTEFSTDTKLHEEFAPYVEFPSISICNYNRFFNITDHHELAAVDGLIRLSSPARLQSEDALWEKYIHDYYQDSKHSIFLSDEVEKRGWQLSEQTIMKCTFHHKPCNYTSFSSFITTMGKCFTFNSHEKKQSIPGDGHGLKITLNVMQDLYSEHPDYGRPEAGVKVHVHPHDEPPMVEELGTAVPAGTVGLISIKKVERELMSGPWGICNENPKKMKYHHKYSFAECMTECRYCGVSQLTHQWTSYSNSCFTIGYVIKKCGCKPYWTYQVHDALECDVWNMINCSGDAEADSLNLTPDECGCDQPCHSVGFVQTLSYATYPGVLVGEILAADEENPEKGSNDIESHIMTANELNMSEIDPFRVKLNAYRDNHLMLDIFHETLSFTRVTQSKKITEMSLASDFGGLLGLWLGISVVTVAEIVQFFLQLLAAFLKKRPVVLPVEHV